MNSKSAAPSASTTTFGTAPLQSESDQISQNIEAVLAFYAREDQRISRSQRSLERAGDFIARPVFLGLILLFLSLWIVTSVVLRRLGIADFDPPPFFWLQGIVSLGAFLVATAVLIKQDRLGKLSEQREHLYLKVTLLTEQKTAKLIELIEELRHDLPNVQNRHDPEVAALKQSMNPDQVLAALAEGGEPGKGAKPTGEIKLKPGGDSE